MKLLFELKRCLRKIDLFGQPIQLSFDGTPQQKSQVGGLLTLLLLVLFFILVSQSFLDIVLKSHLSTFTTENYETNPPYLDLSPRKMDWVISFNRPIMNTWGNGSFFQIDLQQVTQTRDFAGNIIKTKDIIQLLPCNLEDFSIDTKKALLAITTNVSSLLCPKREEKNYFVQGKFSSQQFSYIKIKVNGCVNTKNITCATKNEIDKVFSDNNNQINFQLYFVNNMINVNDLNQPITSFLDDRIYVTINRNKFQEFNYYFTKNKIFTDQSLVANDIKEDYNTFTYENNYDSTMVDISSSSLAYCTLFLRSNFISKTHTRTFDKIWKFISYVGGVWSIFIMVFGIVGRSYNKFKLFLRISNELFDFSEEIHGEALLPVKKMCCEKGLSQKNQNFFSIFSKNKSENQNSMITNIKTDVSSKLKFGFKSFLRFIFRKKNRIDFRKQKELKSEAFLEINKNLDVVQLIQKLKEIDKLKDLFLNENQRTIFDISKKTKIYLLKKNDESDFRKRLNYMEMPKKKRTKLQIDEMLEEIQKSSRAMASLKEEEGNSKELNDRLIKLVDPNKMTFFEEFQKNSSLNSTNRVLTFEKAKLKK